MKIAFVGDIMLGRLVNGALIDRPAVSVWGDTLPILRGADLRIGNLECVITDKSERWSETTKEFFFRSDVKNVAVLAEAGINAVSLANNHILDFGEEGMGDSFGLLKRAGIYYAGAGKNFGEAMKPAIWTTGGKKIGMISFTDNMPEWGATPNKAGTYQGKDLLQLIKETKKKVEFLVVAAHWGGNWGYNPPEEHRELAKAMIDAGADIIFGTSPHVFRGIEIYKEKAIIYSAGDFVDDYKVDEIERNDQSFIFVAETNAHGINSVFLYPTLIANMMASTAKGGERNSIQQKMASLCKDLGTTTKWNEMRGRLEIPIKRD